MDPLILAGSAMAMLAPYVKKGAEELVGAVADVAYGKAKQLIARLKEKWSGDKEATAVLEEFEQKPAVYQAVLEDTLKTKLSADTQFRGELQELLQKMGATVEVNLVATDGDEATGVQAGNVRAGAKVKVDMQTKNVKKSTGATLGDIG